MESISNLSLAIIILDSDLKVVSYSQAAVNYCIFDKKSDSFDDQKFKFKINNIKNFLYSSLEKNKVNQIKFEWQKRTYILQISPHNDFIGKIIGVALTFEDVTEYGDIRNLCKQTTIMNKQYIEASYDGYWDWYIQEDYEYMSPRFWEMFGYMPEEKEHKPSAWMDMIFPEDLELAKSNLEKHFQTHGQHPYSQEIRYRHKNGSTITVLCRGKVILWDSDGKPLRMIGTHTDITDKKINIDNLNEFTYIVSHDLREPARSLAFLSSMIIEQNKNLSEDLSYDLKRIEKLSSHIISMLDELKEYTYIQHDKSSQTTVDSNKIVKNLINLFDE